MKSRFACGLLLAALLLALAPSASSQCAMCANAAAAQQAQARKALNLGIAALVAPAFLLIGGFVVLAYQRRNAPDEPSGEQPLWKEPADTKVKVVRIRMDSPTDRSRPYV